VAFRDRSGGAGVSGPAGLDRDDVGGVRADRQRRLDPGDDVGGGHVPVQQQDLDQHAGRGGLPVRAAGR
jgi:hypothetical protein